MFRVLPRLAVMAIFHAAWCGSAMADPDISVVSVSIDNGVSHMAVAGNTRVDVITAVHRGLEECHLPAETIHVGPYLRLPENAPHEPQNRSHLTVCIGDRVGPKAPTAHIGITSDVPFKVVTAIAAELRACGFTDVRLLSDDTVRQEISERR